MLKKTDFVQLPYTKRDKPKLMRTENKNTIEIIKWLADYSRNDKDNYVSLLLAKCRTGIMRLLPKIAWECP